MRSFLLFLFLSLPILAQQDDARNRPPTVAPMVNEIITVDAGESLTIPGPSAIALLQAIIGVTGGSTNGVITSWTYTEGPFFAELAQQFGTTNLSTFTAVGRYELTVRAQKGAFFNTNSLFIFVTNQGITNFNPTIVMTSPINGAEFTTPINLLLSADAQDKDGDITQVIFYDGATILGTSAVAPYTLVLTNLAAGNYVFAASVEDNRTATNLSTSVSVAVRSTNIVVLTPPIVTLLIPTNNVTFTAPVTFDITASAADLDGIVTSVSFYDNDVLLATIATIDLELNPDSGELAPYAVTYSPTVGSHTLRAVALDSDSLASSTSVIITVLNPPNALPTVTLTAPANGASFTAPATIAVTATAADSDGSISFVRFFLDGVQMDSDSSDPYEATFTNLTAGTYAIHVQAVDNIGAGTLSATNAITVSPPVGVPPTVALTSPTDGQAFSAGDTVTLTASASDDGTVTNVSFHSLSQGSPPAPGPATIVNDNGAVVYVGSWTYNSSVSSRFGSDEHYANSTGASASLTFNGNKISWFATKLSNRGNADVFIDNVFQATVDEYSATALHQQELYTKSDLASGTHTIKIVCKGTKNASSTGFYVDVDYFSYSSDNPAVPSVETLVAEDQVAPYTQSWVPTANSYSLTAKAYDNLGLISTSAVVMITVNPLIPPVVQLTSPTNGAVFAQGSTIPLAATASDQDGTVTNVTFMQFQPDVFILSDQAAPYTGSWTNVPAGSYSLVATARDNTGLNTISPAVSITITPTPPQTVMVDAGPFRTSTLSPYKAEFDLEHTAQSATWDALVASGTGANYFNFQYVLDGTVSVYEGTRETNYINRALVWCETMVSKAAIFDTNGQRNWSGTWASPYSSTNIAFQIESFQGASAMSRCARVIMADPDLRAAYGTRATAVYDFVRDHIVNRDLITRNGYGTFANLSQTITSPTDDKVLLLLRLILDLKAISTALANGDTATYSWATRANELAEGVKDYNGKEARFLPWQQLNALVWGKGKTWQTFTEFDTDSANRLPFVVVQGYEQGQTFTLTHVTGLADLWSKVLWDQSTSSPQVKNFLDGGNGAYMGRPAWANGKTYDGFFLLGAYNQGALNAAKYIATAVRAGTVNPTLTVHNSNFGRTAMAGHLARGVAMLESPPYAILAGTVSGSGTTGTNWTHVSGPSGWTIVTPTRPVTTILFTSAAVGSHTFRLTITSAGPTISDDVVVTVLAAPAFGTIVGGTPPPTGPVTNMFQKRYIFYRTGSSGLNTSALYNRLTNVVRRGAAVGYNGIVLEEPNGRSLTPNGTGLANLTNIKNLAASLGMIIIPYTFGAGEADLTGPTELREAFPVVDTKFVRSGGTAAPVGDPVPVLVNGGFESFSGNQPTGWVVDAGYVFIDTVEKNSGSASIRMRNPTVNPNRGRASQDIAVVPFRAYKMVAWVKTVNFTKPLAIKFLVTGNNNDKRTLWMNRDRPMGSADVASNQDWKRYEADINPLENTSIKFWVVCSSSATGEVWFDDITFTETGLYDTIRRSSTPVVVTAYAGAPTYTEGSDYTVSSEALTIPGGSTIPAGASLKVDWWQKANMAENNNIPAVTHPEFFQVLTTNWGLINTRLAPPAVMLKYNEMRVINWDPVYGAVNSGLYLSNLVMKTETLINTITPSAEKYIWNDLWSPWHNALVLSFMNKGTMHGSWNGVSTNMIVMNWQSTDKLNELKFWGGLDATFPIPRHRQIIASFESAGTMTSWLSALTTAEAQGLRDVVGFMYVTWDPGSDGLQGNYAPIEAVANAVKTATPMRWLTGPALP